MRKIVFITGTRADFGKIKQLIKAIDQDSKYICYVFVSGMHLLETHGSTYEEVIKEGYHNIHVAHDLQYTNNMSLNLGETITKFTKYILQISPDLIVVHGDRIDALAAAMAGALNNIRVAHIEGGEVSGTIDESIRHSVSKFAHVHYTCNEQATKRLIQMGEDKNMIFEIGSPDIDIMLSEDLPPIDEAKRRYEIDFEKYAILMYHPVTTEILELESHVEQLLSAVTESNLNYIVIFPNNDLGSDLIIDKYSKLNKNSKFRFFPSIRFEYFLTLLKNAEFILGNSSAGVRESGVYAIPAIDVGSRQAGRYNKKTAPNVQSVAEEREEILNAIKVYKNYCISTQTFGRGNSKELFLESINSKEFWTSGLQKKFIDLGE